MVFVRRAAENRPGHDPGVLECDAVVSPEEADGEMWGGGWGRGGGKEVGEVLCYTWSLIAKTMTTQKPLIHFLNKKVKRVLSLSLHFQKLLFNYM